jgi:hypothetical protein
LQKSFPTAINQNVDRSVANILPWSLAAVPPSSSSSHQLITLSDLIVSAIGNEIQT